jgi:ParB/RepB/Spo0J family partition protein
MINTDNIPGVFENGKITARVGSTVRLPLDVIIPNRDQPRKYFSEKSITELSKTYKKKKDVETPILVTIRSNGESDFALIINGERRWRAAKEAKLKAISCFIREEMTDNEVFVISAKTNWNQENMSPIEEAHVVKRFQSMGYSVEEIAEEMGKSVGTLYNLLKYLKLNDEIQGLLLVGKIDKGLALQLATYPKADQRFMLDVLWKAAMTKGKPLHPNEAARILRGAAQNKGIKLQKGKRGKTHKTHEGLVLSNVEVRGNEFLQSIKELLLLDEDGIAKVTKPHPLDISELMKRIRLLMNRAEEKLRSIT